MTTHAKSCMSKIPFTKYVAVLNPGFVCCRNTMRYHATPVSYVLRILVIQSLDDLPRAPILCPLYI